MTCQCNAFLQIELRDTRRISDALKAIGKGGVGREKLRAARQDFSVAFSGFFDTLYSPEWWSTGPSTGLEVEKAWGVGTKP